MDSPDTEWDILNRIAAFVGELTPDGVLVRANTTALEAANLRTSDVIGKPFWDTHWWMHSEHERERLRAAISKAAIGEHIRYDANVETMPGTIITIDFQLVPRFDADGAVACIIPSGIDISDRLRNERKLAEANAFLDTLFDTAPVGMGIFDREFRVRRINKKLADINGIAPEDHIGKRPDELLPDLENIEEVYDIWRGILESGKPVTDVEVIGETPLLPGIRRIWSEHFFPVTGPGDAIVGICTIAEEITEQVKSRQELVASQSRLQTLFDSIDEGFCICDMIIDDDGKPVDYRFVETNALFEDATGLKDAGGKTALELVPDLEHKWIEKYARAALGRERFRFEDDSAALNKTFDVFVTPVVPHGRFAIVFRDITERRKTESHREVLMKELNHRVKNTLATVQAMARQTIRHSTSLDEFDEAFSGRIRAIAAAHDILVNEKQQSGTLRALIEKQVQPYAGQSETSLQISGESVVLDGERAHALGLVLHELATNAAKYGGLSVPDGRVSIKWSIAANAEFERLLTIRWREENGPPVKAPETTGFGTRLINTSLSHSLGGQADIDYKADGVEVTIELPMDSCDND